ncbi:aryl-alcohol oxidase 3 [Asimina triloba]
MISWKKQRKPSRRGRQGGSVVRMETGYKNRKKKLASAVNGQRFQFSTVEDPSITSLEFLRTRIHFTGPKLGCGEGN